MSTSPRWAGSSQAPDRGVLAGRLRFRRNASICALIPHTDFGVCPGEIRLKPPVAQGESRSVVCPWRLTGKGKDMALPDFSMRQLLDAGVHFGHQTHRWNPKMSPFIFGARNNIHIMDLSQTVPMLHQALKVVSDTVAAGGRVLFVGTKRQASDIVADAAQRSAQYYVNSRWLGGMLTNWKTISNSISRLRKLDELLAGEAHGFTKKERLNLDREREKLTKALGGIKDMGSTPDLMFVIDTNKEAIAIEEAKRLGIPVVAIIDSNCNPDKIDYPIPGNDDAQRAISLYCDLIARAALDGIARQHGSMGVDIGASVEAPVETALDDAAPTA
jgi:small subunit ribosomal protein S2